MSAIRLREEQIYEGNVGIQVEILNCLDSFETNNTRVCN
jgi:hypothetical protein